MSVFQGQRGRRTYKRERWNDGNDDTDKWDAAVATAVHIVSYRRSMFLQRVCQYECQI